MKIGFIGTGIMGRPMAGHLLKAGHELFIVKHRSPAPPELIEGGAKLCANPTDVARAADIIITMLPDTPQVEQVLFGPKGVSAGLSDGKTVIDMSSIDPGATREFAAKL